MVAHAADARTALIRTNIDATEQNLGTLDELFLLALRHRRTVSEFIGQRAHDAQQTASLFPSCGTGELIEHAAVVQHSLCEVNRLIKQTRSY